MTRSVFSVRAPNPEIRLTFMIFSCTRWRLRFANISASSSASVSELLQKELASDELSWSFWHPSDGCSRARLRGYMNPLFCSHQFTFSDTMKVELYQCHTAPSSQLVLVAPRLGCRSRCAPRARRAGHLDLRAAHAVTPLTMLFESRLRTRRDPSLFLRMGCR